MIPTPRILIAAAAATAALLITLAVLQYNWIGQVSRAEREGMLKSLQLAADGIVEDFDFEIARAFFSFQTPPSRDLQPAEVLSESWRAWETTALEPDLVDGIYYLEQADRRSEPEIFRLEPQTAVLVPHPWDQRLEPLKRASGMQASDPSRRPPGRARGLGARSNIVAEMPALLFPVPPTPPPERSDREAARRGSGTRAWIAISLDRGVITDRLLPELIEARLGPEPREVEVAILDTDGRSAVFRSSSGIYPVAQGDVHRPMFTLRIFPELRAQGFQRLFDDPEERRRLETMLGAEERRRRRAPFPRLEQDAAWTLVLTRVEGSLEAAVARVRQRNLAVSLAVLVLLGATVLALFFSARQAQALAQRQLEFVTGITHELHTPLAAIASAAENLSDGVVRDQDQIRRYGRMLKGESGRLRNMVGQVLDLASTARAPESMQPRALSVVTVLESVLEEHDWTLSEGAFTIEKNFEEGLPAALVDPEAFHRALHNVVGNAIKYGGRREKWVGLKVDHEAAGREGRLCIRVQDRGPGIPRTEQRRIFDPFYRGTAVASGHIHGTGLGLAVARRLLEANGGSLELELSERGRGSTFVVRVPQAPDTVPQEEKIKDEASSV